MSRKKTNSQKHYQKIQTKIISTSSASTTLGLVNHVFIGFYTGIKWTNWINTFLRHMEEYRPIRLCNKRKSKKQTKSVDKHWRKLVHTQKHHSKHYFQSKPTHLLLLWYQNRNTAKSCSSQERATSLGPILRRLCIKLLQKAKPKPIFISIPIFSFIPLLQGCVVCWLAGREAGRGAPKSSSHIKFVLKPQMCLLKQALT